LAGPIICFSNIIGRLFVLVSNADCQMADTHYQPIIGAPLMTTWNQWRHRQQEVEHPVTVT